MINLQIDTIGELADSNLIFKRGELLQQHGAFSRVHEGPTDGCYLYEVDGNYGTYRTEIELTNEIATSCDCPYPGPGCKHVVAILLELFDQQIQGQDKRAATAAVEQNSSLSADEIRQQAIEDRQKRGKREKFTVYQGDMLKGDHLVTTEKGKQYQVTIHDPKIDAGHCSCPDFHFNRLSICKHLINVGALLREQKNFDRRVGKESFPYIDIFWDSTVERIRMFSEKDHDKIGDQLGVLLEEMFDEQNLFRNSDLSEFIPYLQKLEQHKLVRVQEPVLAKLERAAIDKELEQVATGGEPELSSFLKIEPYRYQKVGIAFGLYKKAVLIGDEMGLGKTLQAIALAILKKDIFGFNKVLVVTLSTLKQQWQREIEHFSNEKGCIIAGSARQRKQQYSQETNLFRITNYEAVLRDVTILKRFKPDLIILDEAQRIKNFKTKTAEAIKSLPRQHAIVLTGTPLENKLEDVYSLTQFLDPDLLSPLWQFAADHFLLNRNKKGEILGYTNLNKLHEKLKPLVIRRRKEEVMDDLPELVVNNFFIDLHQEQREIHAGYSQSLLPLLKKKFLTPMDQRRIQALLVKMRQACNSTYLIDKQTNISPKLGELAAILEELIIENERKVVIFSEWTTMTMLIGMHLSRVGIPFVELSGKIPVKKRQPLIDEFNTNPDCKVFLSTDSGGTGLNLQAADCVVNFELPWNPAKLNQRIGRVHRIGQSSSSINVINLIAKNSIEERILTGIKLKMDVFDGVFDGGKEEVLFSRERRQELLSQLREMIDEEEMVLGSGPVDTEELAENTPHFLNPEVLSREVDYLAEEVMADFTEQPSPSADESAEAPVHSVAQMEEVLNQGMGFINGLLQMATGQNLGEAADGEKMVSVDKATGEVTLKFTLPGITKTG